MVDPYQVGPDGLAGVPGDVSGLDGRMVGVAGGASFLLCRRASRMNRHAAQWALPGGRVDEGETPEETALRELDGARRAPARIRRPRSARRGCYGTRSGYVMTPVVVWGGGALDLRPHPDEVAAVYRIGVHHLTRDDSPRFRRDPRERSTRRQCGFGGDLIHAPTGAVLVQFRWVALDGRPSDEARVHDFEQPVFAWR